MTGLDPIVARVVERLLWPLLQRSLFGVQVQITLYGPSGGGKSIVTSLIAYELVNQMRSHYVKTLVGDQGENAVKAQRFRLPNSRFVIVYFVEAMKLRAGSSSPELIAYRLRNYLNCLQFEVVRASRRSQDALGTPDAVANEATGPLALLVIDNFDALFASEDELRKRPRRPRDPSALRSDLYRQPYDVGGFLTDLERGSSRSGGRGSQARKAGASGSTTSPESILGNEGTLSTQWRDVRILRLERFPWLVPSSMNTARIPHLFVDLPTAATRRSIITTTITNLLYRNMSAWLDERLRLQEEYRTVERLYTAKKALQGRVEPFNLSSSNLERNNEVYSLQRKLRGLRWVLTEDQRPPCSGPVSSTSTFAAGETIDGQSLSSTGNEWGATGNEWEREAVSKGREQPAVHYRPMHVFGMWNEVCVPW